MCRPIHAKNNGWRDDVTSTHFHTSVSTVVRICVWQHRTNKTDLEKNKNWWRDSALEPKTNTQSHVQKIYRSRGTREKIWNGTRLCLYIRIVLLLDGMMQHTHHAGIFHFCISIYFPSHRERRMERGLSLWSRGVYHKVGKWVSVHPLDTGADERTFEAVWLFLLRSPPFRLYGQYRFPLYCPAFVHVGIFILFLFLVPLQRQMEETQGGGKRNAVRIANRCRALWKCWIVEGLLTAPQLRILGGFNWKWRRKSISDVFYQAETLCRDQRV